MPAMVARKRGRIINVTGGGTATSFPNGSGYATSKAGLLRFTECVSDTLAGTGVLVFAMDPGLVRTAMTELQLQSEAGRTYLTDIPRLFEMGVDVPPTLAARLSVEISCRPVRPARRPHADGGSRRSRPRRGDGRPNRRRGSQEPAGQRNAAGATVRTLANRLWCDQKNRAATLREATVAMASSLSNLAERGMAVERIAAWAHSADYSCRSATRKRGSFSRMFSEWFCSDSVSTYWRTISITSHATRGRV